MNFHLKNFFLLRLYAGHESPYLIKMNFLRSQVRSNKEESNESTVHEFILIDKSKKSPELHGFTKLRKRVFGGIRSQESSQASASAHSSKAHSIANSTSESPLPTNNRTSTLKPFSKLKKTHLFGVRLEKLCASPYELPPQIIVNY